MLMLFFPYLPKNQRSVPSLRKALAISGFQEQLLRGEAQASCSCKGTPIPFIIIIIITTQASSNQCVESVSSYLNASTASLLHSA